MGLTCVAVFVGCCATTMHMPSCPPALGLQVHWLMPSRNVHCDPQGKAAQKHIGNIFALVDGAHDGWDHLFRTAFQWPLLRTLGFPLCSSALAQDLGSLCSSALAQDPDIITKFLPGIVGTATPVSAACSAVSNMRTSEMWPCIWTKASKTFERSDFLTTCQNASQNAATRSTGPGRNQKTRSSQHQTSIESSTFSGSSQFLCSSRKFQSSSSQAASCQSFHFQASSSWQAFSFSRHHRHHPD